MRAFPLFLFLAFAPPCLAAGFLGPGAPAPVARAADVQAAADDAPCTLEGRLVEKIRNRKNRYLFEDGSGQVIVEINKKVFGGLTITPENIVRLDGEVERDKKYPNEVEVDSIIILK